MKMSMPHAGRTLDDINEHSKLVAWSCYTIVNICANCMPNILLLKGRKKKINSLYFSFGFIRYCSSRTADFK
jgi:hypothetical protein